MAKTYVEFELSKDKNVKIINVGTDEKPVYKWVEEKKGDKKK